MMQAGIDDQAHRPPHLARELAEALETSQQNVSKHLAALADAGILGRRKEGNRVYCRIVDESVFALCEQVCGSLQQQLRALNELVEGVRV